MHTEFRAIVQSEYGAPEKVLRIAKRQSKSEELGADNVLVRVVAQPIHPGDIQIVSAFPQGTRLAPLQYDGKSCLRQPGVRTQCTSAADPS